MTPQEIRDLTQSAAGASDTDTVSITGAQLRALLVTAEPDEPPVSIVICDRGWVFVGRPARTAHGRLTILDAQCIRKWGTTRGLGEIAEGGPTSNTVLDPYGVVRVSTLAVIGTVDCNVEAWSGRLSGRLSSLTPASPAKTGPRSRS